MNFFIFFCICFNFFAQEVRNKFEHLKMDDGLTHNNVNHIFKDVAGYMWFSTDYGLNKFDGQNFTSFTFTQFNKNTFSSNLVRSVFQSNNGTLWVSTDKGICQISSTKDDILNFNFAENVHEKIKHTRINWVSEDHLNRIWVSTKKHGLFIYNNNAFLPMQHVFNIKIKQIFKRESKTYFIARKGYFVLDGNRSIENMNFVSLDTHVSGRSILKNNRLIYVSQNQINFHYLDTKSTIQKSILIDGAIVEIVQQSDHLYWIATFNGLYRYNLKTENIDTYKHVNFVLSSISSNIILDLFFDDQNILWVATAFNGINKLIINKLQFKSYKFSSVTPFPSDYVEINALEVDKNNQLWVGNTSSIIVHNDSGFKEIQMNDNWKGNITDILDDGEETTWVSQWGGPLLKYDRNKKKIIPLSETKLRSDKKIATNNTSSMYLLDNELWLTSDHAGLFRYSYKTKSFIQFRHDPNNNNSLSTNRTISIFVEDSNNIFIGTFGGGLNVFNPTDTIFTRLNDYRLNYVTSFYNDSKDNFWLGTLDQGLILFDRQKKRVEKQICIEKGLAFNSVVDLVEDEFNNLWVLTENGLSRIEPNGHIDNYYKSDGLTNNRYRRKALAKFSNGKIAVGGDEGYDIFDPSEIKRKSYTSPIVINQFKINGVQLDHSKEIEFDYTKANVSITFALLDYINANKVQYRYKLIGLSDKWVNIKHSNEVFFPALNAGEYSFILSTKIGSQWNNSDNILHFKIHPPFWETYTFLIALFIVLTLCLIIAYKFRMYSLKKEKENLESQVYQRTRLIEQQKEELLEINSMKSKFFANLSHEFRTPLTLIISPLEDSVKGVLSRSQLPLKLMLNQSKRLLRLINELLDLSKIENKKKKLRFQQQDISRFIHDLVKEFKNVSEKQIIELSFHSYPKQIFCLFDPHAIEKVICNLLSNAIKSCNKNGFISVQMIEWDNKIKITIKDSGKGIKKDELQYIFDRFYVTETSENHNSLSSGIGLSLSKDLVELHNGKISVTSEFGVGTEFIIEIPKYTNQTLIGYCHLDKEHISEITDEYVQKSSTYEPSKTKKYTVLIVDDNKNLCDLISSQLKSDYNIMVGNNGEEGFRIASKELPDIIISDIMMPKSNGIDFCKKLKSNISTDHIPILFLTAKSSEDSKLKGLEVGALDYLLKPFSREELLLKIKNVLANAEKLKLKLHKKFTAKIVTEDAVPNKFLIKLVNVIETHISDADLTVDTISQEIGMSQSTLYRKLKSIVGLSPNEFIRSTRLNYAAKKLNENNYNVSEVANNAGFISLSYFTKSFNEQFGVNPSKYKP